MSYFQWGAILYLIGIVLMVPTLWECIDKCTKEDDNDR